MLMLAIQQRGFDFTRFLPLDHVLSRKRKSRASASHRRFFERNRSAVKSSISVAVWQAHFAACMYWWRLRRKHHTEFFGGDDAKRCMASPRPQLRGWQKRRSPIRMRQEEGKLMAR